MIYLLFRNHLLSNINIVTYFNFTHSMQKEMVCFQNAPVTEEAAIEVAPPAAAIEVSNVPTFVPLAPAVRPPPIQHANTSMVRVPFPSGVYFQECHSQA